MPLDFNVLDPLGNMVGVCLSFLVECFFGFRLVKIIQPPKRIRDVGFIVNQSRRRFF